MSAWSQAVWVVQELQKNFNFSNLINEENARLDTLQEKIAQDEEYITNGTVTLLAGKKNDNTPDTTLTTFARGTIWFVQG